LNTPRESDLQLGVDHEDRGIDTGADGAIAIPFDPSIAFRLVTVVQDVKKRHLGEADLRRVQRRELEQPRPRRCSLSRQRRQIPQKNE
jgi:hypothetical protein